MKYSNTEKFVHNDHVGFIQRMWLVLTFEDLPIYLAKLVHKGENYLIISTDMENLFDKILHTLY